MLEAFQTCGRSLLTSELKRLFIVADISQSGMCGEEGRYPAVYVPIPKVASLLADSLHRLLSGPQRRSIPLMGAGLRHHHVASAAGSFEGRELNAAASPQPPLAAKITGFTSLPRRAMVTQRGCNVNRRWVSGHAILWRNWRQNSSILSTVLLVVFLVLYALLRTIQ